MVELEPAEASFLYPRNEVPAGMLSLGDSRRGRMHGSALAVSQLC